MDRMDFRGRGGRRSHLVRLDRCSTAGLALWCVAAMRSQSAVDRCQAGEAWNTDWETHREIQQSKESNRFQTLQSKKEQIASSGNHRVLKAHLHHDPTGCFTMERAIWSWASTSVLEQPAGWGRAHSPVCLSSSTTTSSMRPDFNSNPRFWFFLPRNVVCVKPGFWCNSNVLADSPSVPCAF